jgi:hypothetical protein
MSGQGELGPLMLSQASAPTMTNNSHFGLFAGAFALLSLVSVYGSESGPSWFATAHADEVAPPPLGLANDGAVKSFGEPRQLTLPPGLPPLVAERPTPSLRPILAKAQSVADEEVQTADDNSGATVLPLPGSCPAANPATHFAPAPATLSRSPAERLAGSLPPAGLGTGTPCPAAAAHTSIVAGAAPTHLPAGPSGPADDAAPHTPRP